MILIFGDMWHTSADLKLVTTNSYVRKDGALVMGRGAALQAKEKYPDLPYIAGATIKHMNRYGLRIFPQYNTGLFQVKYSYSDDASLELIDFSTNMLCALAHVYCGTIVLNFPGIGNGRLSRDDVMPIVKRLPDNVLLIQQ